MQDLNASMFFKAKFVITSSTEGDDLLWKLILLIKQWLTRKFNRRQHIVISHDLKKWSSFKSGGRLFDEENKGRIFAESAFHVSKTDPSMISWACRITENQKQVDGFAPREWTTEIGFQMADQNAAEISYVVTYSDLAGFIGFCSDVPSMNVPNVIKMLLSDPAIQCTIGSTPLSLAPYELHVGDFPKFYSFLQKAERQVPVLYVSPCFNSENETAETLIDPIKLADSVAGNALVFYSQDPGFTDEMMYLGDRRYTCSAGAVRLYKPGMDLKENTDQYRHRFLSASFIKERPENDILNIFRRALAQDVHFYEDLFRLEQCRALIDADLRDDRIADILERKEQEVDTAMQLAIEECDRLSAQLAVSEHSLKDSEDRNERLKAEKYGLASQVEAMRGQVEKASAMSAALNGMRKFQRYPETADMIASYYAVVFKDRLAFTDRALRSLEECSTRPSQLWEAFYYMATDLYDLLQQKHPQFEKEFKRVTGWDCSRGEGSMTRKDPKLMRQYYDEYDGFEIDVQAHVKYGTKESDSRFLRIYFAYDPDVSQKVIISYCGKHLKNFSSRKL